MNIAIIIYNNMRAQPYQTTFQQAVTTDIPLYIIAPPSEYVSYIRTAGTLNQLK